MKEQVPENEDYLNQAAKKALIKLKQDADPSMLYSLQLVDWLLESGKVVINQRLHPGDLPGSVKVAMGWPPNVAMQLFHGGPDLDLGEDYPTPEKDPEDLAWQLMEIVDGSFLEITPNYGVAS